MRTLIFAKNRRGINATQQLPLREPSAFGGREPARAAACLADMSLRDYQADHTICLKAAADLLGEPARAVDLSAALQQLLRPHLRFEARGGVLGGEAILSLDTEQRGRSLALGLERYRIDVSPPVRIVHVRLPYEDFDAAAFYQFWAVPQSQFRRFYRALRQFQRQAQDAEPPLLPPGDLERLWKNTIGFLRHGRRQLQEFGVSAKRGVLLLGEPGNGKTMAARWLRGECQRHGFEWRSVTAERFAEATRDGEANLLFDLASPGLVLFDDVDLALRDREQFGATPDHSTFLAGLDGLDMRKGVVYVFTSNAELRDLDPAFRRPGRIDVVMRFPRPDDELRRRVIETRWHAETLRALNLDRVTRQTEGLSFADLEELRKLLVLRYLDTQVWDWRRAWMDFETGRGQLQRGGIGFLDAVRPLSSSAAVA